MSLEKIDNVNKDEKVIKKFNRLRNITWHRKEVNDAFLS